MFFFVTIFKRVDDLSEKNLDIFMKVVIIIRIVYEDTNLKDELLLVNL